MGGWGHCPPTRRLLGERTGEVGHNKAEQIDPPTQTSAHFDSEPKKWEVNSAFLSPIWVTHKNINLVGFLTSKLPKTSDMSNPSIAVEENQMVPV